MKRRRFFWRPSPDQQVDDELSQHIEELTQRNIARGMSPAEAREAALARFGDADHIREQCRTLAHTIESDMRRAETLADLKQDAIYAVRTFRRAPLFTAVAIITLALGIGANTAIFSVVNAALIRPVPYEHAASAAVIWNSYGAGLSKFAIAAPEFADMRDNLTTLDVAALRWQAGTVGGECGTRGGECDAERVSAYIVSPELFTLLGARAQLGRTFRPDDGAQGAELVVLISDVLWRRRFGADSGIVDDTVTLGGVRRRVIGVMPRGVRFPDAPVGYLKEAADLWIPFSWERARAGDRGNQNLAVVGRLRDGATLQSAQNDLDRLATGFRTQFPSRYARADAPWCLAAISLSDETVGSARRGLLLLFGAVGFVLLIACANVANLMLARGASREREFAVRASLGASRARLVRQLLTESALLGAAGGVLGLACAIAVTTVLERAGTDALAGITGVGVDATVATFCVALALVSTVLFGSAPAWQFSRHDTQASLAASSRGVARGVRRRFRQSLVVVEVALSAVILVGAGLLVRSFTALQSVDTGVGRESVLTFQIGLPGGLYDSAHKVLAFHADLSSRVDAIDGVRASGIAYPLPMGGEGWGGSYYMADPGAPELHAEYSVASPGYFAAIGVPLLAGRDFLTSDRSDAPEVVIVDEVLATRHWGSAQNAIGRMMNPNNNPGENAMIVGVVGHVRRGGPRTEGEPQIYRSMLRSPEWRVWYVVRGSGDALAMVASVRRAVRAADPNVAVARLASMTQVIARATARERFSMWALAGLGAAALVLAAVGLYGVMAYLVSQRTHELGIRLALGARPGSVVGLIVGDAMRMAIVGIVLGLGAALALSRSLRGLLFGVAETDAFTYVVVGSVLLLVALLAAVVPARRATRVDPVLSLRR